LVYYLFICHIFGELSLNSLTSFACIGVGCYCVGVDVGVGVVGLDIERGHVLGFVVVGFTSRVTDFFKKSYLLGRLGFL